MMKILVGYDGSQSADAALADLRRAGLPPEAEALIVSVADVMMAPATPHYELVGQALTSRRVTSGLMYAEQQNARVVNEAGAFASKATNQLRRYFPNWYVRSETPNGIAAWELIDKANEWKPDLVVVGSHGRSAVGRLLLGSVSKKIVTTSQHSVRIGRGAIDIDVTQPPKLVIGIDGSPEAERAVRAVGTRVWPYGTEVRIVSVDDHIPSVLRGYDAPLASQPMVQWAEHELSLIGLKVSVNLTKGDPRRVLIEQARQWDADAIFVGGRRFSTALQRFQLGSVATALVTKAHCSVEVVRNPI
jgi:Universal stress protein UspA and related nucleotide-binding proteins